MTTPVKRTATQRHPKPPTKLFAVDRAIKEYVERKAAVIALRTADKGFRQAESEFRRATLTLKNHLLQLISYEGPDGSRYSYSIHEDAIHVVPRVGEKRGKKGHGNRPVVKTTDERELLRQEFVRQAAADHASRAAEKSNAGGCKR